MILRITSDQGGTVDVCESPSEADVAKALAGTDWGQFASVGVYMDDENWLDGSGSLAPDWGGLAMMLSVDGVQFVTESAPESPEAMVPLFDAYLKGDHNLLYALIYDAKQRGLSPEDVETLRQKDIREQS